MKMHILTENRVKKRGLLAEHGLSVFIENQDLRVLFDVGQSNVYCRNAEYMGLDLKSTDAIVLSHGHYDHCGGLIHFPSAHLSSVYVHLDAFKKRYIVNADGKSYREIGIPWSMEQYLFIKDKIVYNSHETEIAPGVFLLAEVPYITDFETAPDGFYIDNPTGQTADQMKDEQMLVFDTDKGLSIFLGCSHPGVINCLQYARKRFPGKSIYSLAAGMHLDSVSPIRLQKTIQCFMDFDIQKVIPLHCTGILAISEMKRILKERCFTLCTGDTLEL